MIILKIALSLKVGAPRLFCSVALSSTIGFYFTPYGVAPGQFVWLTVWYSVTSTNGHVWLHVPNRVCVGVTGQFEFGHGIVLVFVTVPCTAQCGINDRTDFVYGCGIGEA